MTEPKYESGVSLPSQTRRVNFGCGHLYVTVDEYEGRPARVFLKIGKIGVCKRTLLESIGRLVSIMLEVGVPLERITKTLAGLRCDQGIPAAGRLSCVDALANDLKAYQLNQGGQDGTSGKKETTGPEVEEGTKEIPGTNQGQED